ncbi:MAG: DUF885 family protein [Gemmatimonadales bacterium]
MPAPRRMARPVPRRLLSPPPGERHVHRGRRPPPPPPDHRESALGDQLADWQALLGSARTVTGGTATERRDVAIATGHLEIRIWELGSGHFERGNPSLATGEAIFGVMGLYLAGTLDGAERTAAAVARLEAIPGFLAASRALIERAPAGWTERAIRECDAALRFLSGGVPHLPDGAALAPAAATAQRGFESHRRYLADLLIRPTTDVAAGPEALGRYIGRGHFLRQDAEAIADYAAAALEATETAPQLTTPGARTDRAPSHDQSSSRVDGPSDVVAAYPADRYDRAWSEIRQAVTAAGVLTWPDFPIRFVPRPEWARAAAPDLYFLFYRSPAAFRRPPVHDYLIPDTDPGESQIRLNHVIHHGGIGHHVQNWHAFRAESRLGRIAAVDCASRIALPAGGTMAEGWACYATDLVSELGLLTPAEREDERRTRRRMAARAIVDVQLHQGRMTLEDAATFYERRAGMPAAAARAEAIKNSMFPGAALMYLMGTDTIHELRRDLAARAAAGFDLRAFHDRFLSHGSLPVSLIAEAMRDAPAAG